jgi:type IV pilus assembly protein PilB
MPISDEIQRDHAQRQRDADRRAGQGEGVRDLRQSGLLKVNAGLTSLEEVRGVTNE